MLTPKSMHALQWSNSLRGTFGETNQSELAAFSSYALAFPNNFLALVDTYDVSKNFEISSRCLNILVYNDILRYHVTDICCTGYEEWNPKLLCSRTST